MPLVRLFPRIPQLGYVLRSYTIQEPRPLRFKVETGWYDVDDDVAAVLKDIPQQSRMPLGPKAFQIAADPEEAAEMEEHFSKMLAKATRKEEVGTTDKPVPTRKRPGRKRSTVAASDDDKPKGKPRTRKKKPAATD